MHTKIRKWGNSLGVRIPRAFAAEARVEDGSTVDISMEEGSLRIRSIRRRYSLRELLKKVNPRNVHDEVATDGPVGRESL